jgi:hypothetical protein
MADFGADTAFAGAAQKLQEHYGIRVPISAVRAITQDHGARLLESTPPAPALPERPGVPQLIVELDGSLIPVVETGEPAEDGADRRQTRQVAWQEARLCLAHEPGSVTPIFGGTLGSVDDAGAELLGCAVRAGAGTATQVHGVGDGAPWIPEQVERCFGTQATYLVDFAHLCEYLGGAAEPVAGPEKAAWLATQKARLKANQWPAVLQTLAPWVEPDRVADERAPVRRCHRYIANRPTFLDYQGALAAGLPIGSGEVESAHRYVIQARLKIAGAWWKLANAQKMLALRVVRANGDWARSWAPPALKAA